MVTLVGKSDDWKTLIRKLSNSSDRELVAVSKSLRAQTASGGIHRVTLTRAVAKRVLAQCGVSW
jgi:hypothetical protein